MNPVDPPARWLVLPGLKIARARHCAQRWNSPPVNRGDTGHPHGAAAYSPIT
ncbi:hypothetical protein [Ideonella sp. A 288]|uniref:hypothetical protein n=1 Tax=Ideonella sp. A 288 TaxID=1962181 RepID=UPI001302F763|nr:hypothetical protein [Ideonella sp. A 288]